MLALEQLDKRWVCDAEQLSGMGYAAFLFLQSLFNKLRLKLVRRSIQRKVFIVQPQT